jgi:hypothetical protein
MHRQVWRGRRFAAYPGYVTIKVAKTGVHYQKTMTVEPGKHGGRPAIRGYAYEVCVR